MRDREEVHTLAGGIIPSHYQNAYFLEQYGQGALEMVGFYVKDNLSAIPFPGSVFLENGNTYTEPVWGNETFDEGASTATNLGSVVAFDNKYYISGYLSGSGVLISIYDADKVWSSNTFTMQSGKDFVSGDAYTKGEVVRYSGNDYTCGNDVLATSDPATDTTNWTVGASTIESILPADSSYYQFVNTMGGRLIVASPASNKVYFSRIGSPLDFYTDFEEASGAFYITVDDYIRWMEVYQTRVYIGTKNSEYVIDFVDNLVSLSTAYVRKISTFGCPERSGKAELSTSSCIVGGVCYFTDGYLLYQIGYDDRRRDFVASQILGDYTYNIDGIKEIVGIDKEDFVAFSIKTIASDLSERYLKTYILNTRRGTVVEFNISSVINTVSDVIDPFYYGLLVRDYSGNNLVYRDLMYPAGGAPADYYAYVPFDNTRIQIGYSGSGEYEFVRDIQLQAMKSFTFTFDGSGYATYSGNFFDATDNPLAVPNTYFTTGKAGGLGLLYAYHSGTFIRCQLSSNQIAFSGDITSTTEETLVGIHFDRYATTTKAFNIPNFFARNVDCYVDVTNSVGGSYQSNGGTLTSIPYSTTPTRTSPKTGRVKLPMDSTYENGVNVTIKSTTPDYLAINYVTLVTDVGGY